MFRMLRRILILTEETVIIILSIGILVTVFYGVLVRYLPITGTQMAWTQEVSELFLVWYAFLAIAIVHRQSAHFNLDFIFKRLRGYLKLLVIIFVHILSLIFLIFIALNAISLIINTAGDVSNILRFPMLLFPLALFISCCLMIVYTCHNIIRSFKKS